VRRFDFEAFMIARSLEEALAVITDGCVLAVPREASGVAMAATRALIRRGVKRLNLVALPTSSLQAELLIGAGCVETIETSAVSLGEFSKIKADVDGKMLSDAEWEGKRGDFLPGDEDRAFIESLMQPQYEPGKFASWIAPPKVGIDNKPGEFEYVKIA